MRKAYVGVAAALSLGGLAPLSMGQVILGQHHLSWWDDPVLGSAITQQGAAPPTANSILLFNMDEWHIDQAATANWYNGQAVVGLPANPFNAANRTGMTQGSAIVPVANAEGFIYQVTNVNYFNGNGPPPFQAPPFSFTGPPNMPGQNDLSGFNIQDTHGALQISQVAAGSQFMASSTINSRILDLTAGAVAGAGNQDWDFNAYTGAGNFEWDIDTNGIGASAALPGVVFGYAMPGNWIDAINMGHAHSWNLGAQPLQVNVVGVLPGWSGPQIPAPPGAVALGLGGLLALRRRRGSP